jgi:transcriptional/translational regulatory protein YebC/TACO1
VLDAGAEDFKTETEDYEVLTDPAHFEAVHKAIEAKGIKPAAAEVTWLPSVTIPLQGAKAVEEVSRLLDLLEDHDDVKEVHSNAEFPG